jgi:probable DNA repair protein
VLTPAVLLSPNDEPSAVFNISLGAALAETPVVQVGLQLLRLWIEGLAVLSACDLLQSPFWMAAETELGQRARLDLALREAGLPTLDTAALLAAAERAGPSQCPLLAGALRTVLKLADPDPAAPSLWARRFADLLNTQGWPGERGLSSAEYQAVMAWQELLADLASLDLQLPALSGGAALRKLAELAGATLFQPESPDTPVQVLGMLEAADLPFDHLWVMGLDDETWPGPAEPNPLLPAAFQREHALPRASAERELAYARKLTERLAASAANTIFSYPQADGERNLRPSPLLRDISEIGLDELPISKVPEPGLWSPEPPVLEVISDEGGPALAADGRHYGGSGLIADQSACPFRAFARHRLAAATPAAPPAGVDALTRGNLIHETLRLVWEELGGRATLTTSSEQELQALVRKAAERAIVRQRRQRPDLWGQRRARIESARLAALSLEWLALERQRQDFTVLGTELPRELALGKLALRLRIDRADGLAEGGVALIDYKTGATLKAADWDGERPAATQLPLYALTEPQPPVALLYAGLRKGKCRFVGRAGDKLQLFDNINVFKQIEESEDLPAQVRLWRETITRLAAAFCAGEAAVDPLPQACAHCDLPALCRIHELAYPLGQSEDEGPALSPVEGDDDGD